VAADQFLTDEPIRVGRTIVLRHLLQGAIYRNERQDIVTGVAVKDLHTNRTVFTHNQDTAQFAASINKLPVALLVLQDLRAGKTAMDQRVQWATDDRRDGYGVYDEAGAPTEATVEEVLEDLLNKSGNTAVRILVNKVLGGSAQVNQRWAAEPNLSHTALQPLDENRFYLGNSTPGDALWTIEQLTNKRDTYSQFMSKAMAGNIFNDFGVRSQLPDDADQVLINKVGILDDVEGNNRHDVGVVYDKETKRSYAYAFFTTAPFNETDQGATERADASLKEMGRYTLRYASNKDIKLRQVNNFGDYARQLERRMKY
jgi:beta-lactamase class A